MLKKDKFWLECSLRNILDQYWTASNTKIQPTEKDQKSSYQQSTNFITFWKLIYLILSSNCDEGLTFTKPFSKMKLEWICGNLTWFQIHLWTKYLRRTLVVVVVVLCFFYLGLIHEHSQITKLQGKGEGISLTPHYHVRPPDRQLEISWEITAESSPLHIASSWTRTENLFFKRKSPTNKTNYYGKSR